MTLLYALALLAGTVVAVHDGDGPMRVDTGTQIVKVRLAGIQAPDFTTASPCKEGRAGYVCDNAKAAASRDNLARLALGKRVSCETVGTSYARVVAWCSVSNLQKTQNAIDLSCAQIRGGFATRWRRYDPAGRLGACNPRFRRQK